LATAEIIASVFGSRHYMPGDG